MYGNVVKGVLGTVPAGIGKGKKTKKRRGRTARGGKKSILGLTYFVTYWRGGDSRHRTLRENPSRVERDEHRDEGQDHEEEKKEGLGPEGGKLVPLRKKKKRGTKETSREDK